MLETLGKLPEKLREQVFQTFFANTCGVIYRKLPESLLQSPFILPTAFDSLTDKADLLRISGLDSPPNVLEKLLAPLLDGTTDGLLLYGEYNSRLLPSAICEVTLGDLIEEGAADLFTNCANYCADYDICVEMYERVVNEPASFLL